MDSPNPNSLKLELVQVIFRHGERTPIDLSMNFMNHISKSAFEPYGISQLTNKGRMQEYKLGELLRKNYNEYLGETYKPDDIFAFSSDTDRTKESLQLVLAALYKPSKKLLWNTDLNWMPVAINTLPRKMDVLLNSFTSQIYQFALLEFEKTSEMEEMLDKYKDIKVILEKYYKIKMDIFNLFFIQDGVKILKSFDIPLPEWCTDEIYKKLQLVPKDLFEAENYTPYLIKHNVGFLVKKFIENINLSNNKRKIYLYSGHDRNVYGFAKAHQLNVPGGLSEYGSAFIVEKYTDENNQIFVKVFYWTGVTEELIPIKLNDSSSFYCPLANYLELLDPILPTDDELRNFMDNLKFEDFIPLLYSDSVKT